MISIPDAMRPSWKSVIGAIQKRVTALPKNNLGIYPVKITLYVDRDGRLCSIGPVEAEKLTRSRDD